MCTSGACSGRWWVINAAILLVFSYGLSGCSTDASALSPTIQPPDHKIITVSLYDENNNRILHDAIVQVEGTEQTDTDDDGGYYVDFCITGQYIRAQLSQYDIAREPCETGKREYSIKLTPLLERYSTSPDDSASGMYSWTSAQNCQGSGQGCHSDSNAKHDELQEWKLDGHSRVLTDHFFSTMYTGSDSYRQQGNITDWVLTISGHKARANTQTRYGPGYLLDYPFDQGNCVYCHLPSLVQSETMIANPKNIIESFVGDPTNAITEGITCDNCHKAIDVQLGQDNLPYSDRPGVLSMLYLFPKDSSQLFLGPSQITNPPSQASTHSMCSSVLSEARFCAACHYGKFFDTVIYNSYGEWLNSIYSQRNDNTYRSCQDCHMLWDVSITGTRVEQREACSLANTDFHDFNHNMMEYQAINNSTTPQAVRAGLIKDAATLTVQYQYLADTNAIQIKTVVNNVKAGHKFPTDSPLRHLLLVVDVRDEQKNPLTRLTGDVIPNWGGIGTNVPGMTNYGGMPGQIFANLLMDKDTNVSPTAAYWNPTQLVSANADTRLNPLQPREYNYSFIVPNRGKVYINVKLIYRYAFIDLAQQKSWPLVTSSWPQADTSDIEVVSRSCVVDAKQVELVDCSQ